jgi:hypothetical protein
MMLLLAVVFRTGRPVAWAFIGIPPLLGSQLLGAPADDASYRHLPGLREMSVRDI